VSNDADIYARSSWRNAVLLGFAGGLVSTLVWLLVVIGTGAMQAYLVVGFGIVVALGVHLGARRPGRQAALISMLITMVTVVFATYFVERYLVVKWFTDNSSSKGIPVIPYVDWMASVLEHAFTASPAPAVYTVLALAAAGWFGYVGFESRDPRDRHA
jgi:ascorbate-specific PTS system EIIC-type component UlaA